MPVKGPRRTRWVDIGARKSVHYLTHADRTDLSETCPQRAKRSPGGAQRSVKEFRNPPNVPVVRNADDTPKLDESVPKCESLLRIRSIVGCGG
jgi:hypothetical protein